ncbi:MAG: hypothetical protein IK085_05115, partial [Clostridia bacterium]|nr:hypothetical protein [Clostridia bacterium]
LITADGETFKADLTGTDYGGYDRNRFDFDYAPMVRTGGFTLEAAINFKDGIGSGKTIAVKVMDGSGTESAVRYVKIKPPEEPPTASEKTTKQTTEKTTKEKATKPTTEKTTKPTTSKTEAAKQTSAPETRTKREITHRAVTTTIKVQTSDSANTKSAKTTKAATTKFKAKQNGNKATVTEQQGTSERRTGRYAGTVTYSYITDEYTTAAGTAEGSSKQKRKSPHWSAQLLLLPPAFSEQFPKKTNPVKMKNPKGVKI